MVATDPDSALPILNDILERYSDSAEPGRQRIAAVVTDMITELEQERGEPSERGEPNN